MARGRGLSRLATRWSRIYDVQKVLTGRGSAFGSPGISAGGVKLRPPASVTLTGRVWFVSNSSGMAPVMVRCWACAPLVPGGPRAWSARLAVLRSTLDGQRAGLEPGRWAGPLALAADPGDLAVSVGLDPLAGIVGAEHHTVPLVHEPHSCVAGDSDNGAGVVAGADRVVVEQAWMVGLGVAVHHDLERQDLRVEVGVADRIEGTPCEDHDDAGSQQYSSAMRGAC